MIDRRVACFPADNEFLPRLRAAVGTSSGLPSSSMALSGSALSGSALSGSALSGSASSGGASSGSASSGSASLGLPASGLVPFGDSRALLEAIRAHRVSVTVVFVDSNTFAAAEALLRLIRGSFANHPLVAYYNPRGLSPRHFFNIAQTGISELVHLDLDDSRSNFARIIESASRASYAQRLVSLLARDIPGPLHPVFEFALEHAGRNMAVPELAARLGLSKRTLAWRLAQCGLPSPRVFLTWCRLLVAALLLEEGRTLDSVSDELNFPSGHNLGSMLFRYLDRGIVTLRKEGVIEGVASGFRKALAAPTRTSLPTRTRRG